MTRWTNFPFNPARLPFFYGWVMVFVSVMAILASLPGQTSGVGVFKESLLAAWDLTSIQLATAYMLGTVLSGFALPLAGRMLDRYGARTGMVLSSVGLGASMVLFAQSDRIGLAVSESTAWRVACMTLCFLLIRFFGQGCLAMVSRLAVAKWFNRRRGFASALASPITSFGFGVAPILLGSLIDGQGWRAAALWMAGVIGIGVAIVGGLLFRDTPEECGLTMDGAPARAYDTGGDALPPPPEEREFTCPEALRTLAFWVYSLALGAHALLFTAIAFHIESIGAYHHMTSAEAFALFWPIAFFSVPCTMLMGWLSDRVDLRWLLAVFCLGQFMGITGVYFLDWQWAKYLFYLGYGIGGALFSTLMAVSYPRFYGRRHLGAISGWNMTVIVWASALGPVYFSAAEGLTGDYQAALAFYAVVPIVLLSIGLFARNPQTLPDRSSIPEGR